MLEDGTVAAEAHGRYVKMPIEQIATVEFNDSEWFADELPLPDRIDLGGARLAAPSGRAGAPRGPRCGVA